MPVRLKSVFTSGLRLLPFVAPLALAVILLSPTALLAQGTEVLRGKVTGPDKKPVPGVAVEITGLVTQTVSTAITNDKGIYTALFTNAEGDYILTVRRIGFAPITTRVTRTGISSVLATDFELQPMAVVLDSITALGRRLGGTDGQPSVGGVELNALANAQFLLDPTDLLAMALTVPGVTSVGDSAYSVLGAAATSNNTTVDGTKSGATNIPQDAIASVKVITTSADVSRSGFAGGQTSVILRTGSEVFGSTIRGTFVNPTLSWADPDYPQPPATLGDFSGSISGPIVKKKAHYISSWDLNNRATNVYTLLSAGPSILSQYGFTADTVNAVENALRSLNIPLSVNGAPNNQMLTRFNNTAVIDYSPNSTTSLKLTWQGQWFGYHGLGLSSQALPTTTSRSNSTYQQLTFKGSGYVHGLLNELTESFSYGNNSSTPYSGLPGASVRIGTVFDDGTTGLGNLRFGGGSGFSQGHNFSSDLTDEVSWITSNSKHKIKVGGEFEYDWSTSYSAGNQFGNYSYLTVTDLINNAPASFSRTLDAQQRDSKGTTTSLYIGDEWAPSKALNLQYGWRIDAAHPGTIPDYNPVVDTVFGLHTNRVPNDIGFAPRFGFSWTSKARRGIGTPGGSSGPLAGLSAAQLSSFPPELLMSLLGNARASTTSQPGIGVNGTLGAYKNSISIYSISSLVDQTGLPNTRRTLSCVGPATPVPDWSNINNAPPDDCLDGTGPATFSTNAPTVRVYDPSFRAPLTWRGNLGVDGIRVPFKWVASVTGTLSYGVDGQSSLDLNLNRTPGFMLGGGDGRPVYVTPASIVTGTGAVAPGAYRIDPNFGSVSNTISDIHNYSENMAFTLVPPRPLLHGKITTFQFTYSWLRSETESRAVGNGGGVGLFCSSDGVCSSFGGGAGTAGDPFVKEWVPGTSPTHTFTLLTGFRLWWFNLNIRTSVWSGYPFTPTVSGDINGDGSSSDDRAYVPNPATTSDPVLAAQIRQLLTSGTGAAQSCLLSQMGRIAGANTCHTPWQARLDLAMNFNPPSSWGYGDRLRFTTNMVNASSALVRLLDLENTPLGQSISSPTPNSTLLYVTGFDPATNQFKYQVNQLFGQPINFGSARHKLAPFQVQVGLQYQLGGPLTQPMSRGMGFIPPGKEPPLTIDQIKQRVAKLARNPVPAILALKDTLRLTPKQVTSLDSINTNFKSKSDSMLGPLTNWLIKKGRHVDDAGLSSRLNKVQPALTKLAAEATKGSNALLTAGQRALMPRPQIGGAPGALPPGAAPRGAPPAGTAPPTARPGAVQVPLRTGGGGGGD